MLLQPEHASQEVQEGESSSVHPGLHELLKSGNPETIFLHTESEFLKYVVTSPFRRGRSLELGGTYIGLDGTHLKVFSCADQAAASTKDNKPSHHCSFGPS